MSFEAELAVLHKGDLDNTILAISREFVSNKQYDEVLKGVCRRVAGFVRCLLGSNADAWHIFPDPRLGECTIFRLPVIGAPSVSKCKIKWEQKWMVSQYRFQLDDREALCDLLAPSFPDRNGAPDRSEAIHFIEKQMAERREFVCFSLCRLARPMGYVLLPVHGDLDSEKIRWHLEDLQRKTFDYFEAFYQATARTYLPSFYQRTTKRAAILFCDLRNSTTVFQVLRIGGDEQIQKFLIFLKAFMELAAGYIVSSGLGTIHGFTGDGFIATFGEHLGGRYDDHAGGACAIAAFVAERLHRGFERLYETWLEGMRSFDLEHNEDVSLRLGTGLAYGEVHFDEFGTSRVRAESGATRPGLLYYNAVGDHMNVAARLCSIASADPSVVDVSDRQITLLAEQGGDPPGRAGRSKYIAPIVTTKPFALALTSKGLLREKRQMTVGLKGVGTRIPAHEIWHQSLDLSWSPDRAAHSSMFAPTSVADVANAADGFADRFYGDQVMKVAATETDTVQRLIRKLQEQMPQGSVGKRSLSKEADS